MESPVRKLRGNCTERTQRRTSDRGLCETNPDFPYGGEQPAVHKAAQGCTTPALENPIPDAPATPRYAARLTVLDFSAKGLNAKVKGHEARKVYQSVPFRTICRLTKSGSEKP